MSTHSQSIYEVFEHQKAALALHLLESLSEFNAVMVFVRTRDGVHALTADLSHAGIAVDSIHGNKKPELRDRALKAVVDHKIRALVTTNAMARDLDTTGVGNVIHVDFPELDADYTRCLEFIESSGGQVITFATPQDSKAVSQLEGLIGAELPREKAEGFDYDAQPIHAKPARKSGGTSKGLRSKPLQNKKPKFKNKRGRR
jgi:superfamily II DNA/RNA helicase